MTDMNALADACKRVADGVGGLSARVDSRGKRRADAALSSGMNIRNPEHRESLLSKGHSWATVHPRGESKGSIKSVHETYDAANKAAAGRDRHVMDLNEDHH